MNNQIILQRLQAKLESLVAPSFIDDGYFDMYMSESRGLSESVRAEIHTKYKVKCQLEVDAYTYNRKSLQAAIVHYENLVQVYHALTLIN